MQDEVDYLPYVGFNFIDGPGCQPNVTVVRQAQKAILEDGVEKLILVNQNGAQQSNTTIGVSYEQLV